MVGLGLALAQPARRVLVITGDGELLMGLGALATIAVQKPANLAVVCIDNERYGETGMQATHTAAGVNLSGIAASAGFPCSLGVTDEESLAGAVPLIYDAGGPVFVGVKVRPTHGRPAMPARHGPYLKDRFRRAVLGEREASA
jgi:thiamine pyrophosphate-dependent acetolactate synthase large subunit-like protein